MELNTKNGGQKMGCQEANACRYLWGKGKEQDSIRILLGSSSLYFLVFKFDTIKLFLEMIMVP